MKNLRSEQGQSLVLILLVLMIGAIVAFAIVARTLQDIRRTGQERSSDQAGTQVETYLDAVTADHQWAQFVDDDFEFTEYCNDREDPPGSGICELSETDLAFLFGDLVCEEASVKIRKEDTLLGMDIAQDDVLEVNLGNPSTSGSFNIEWIGSDHLIINVYAEDPSDGSVFLYEDNVNSGTPGPIAFSDSDRVVAGEADDWGSTVNHRMVDTGDGVPETVYYPANALFARIRPIRGTANVSVTNVPPQEMTVKASCFYNEVYREFIRRVPLFDSVPACFDYVLFDGNSAIDEF